MKIKLLILPLTVLFVSCWGGFDVNKHLFGKYYLTATDVIADLDLSYHESESDANYGTIIGATVFAAGFNSNYIIVKQHPETFPNPHNKNIINYYILPIKEEMNWRTKNGLLGPLTLDQFNKKRKELNIPDSLIFTTLIKEVE